MIRSTRSTRHARTSPRRPTSRSGSRRSSRSSIPRRSRSSTGYTGAEGAAPTPRRSAEHVAGELIASEIEIKTGRCETFAGGRAALIASAGATCFDVADALGVGLAACGTHPFARWREQEIIDTPHYRIVEGTLRYVAWRNNTFGIHVHVGIRDADRAHGRHATRCARCSPSCSRCSASLAVARGARTRTCAPRASQIFTRMFPRCGIPDAVQRLGRVRRLRPLPARDRLDPRAHRDLVDDAAAPVVRHGRDARAATRCRRRRVARRLCAAGARWRARFARIYDEGEPLPDLRGTLPRGERLAGDPLGPRRRADRLRSAAWLRARCPSACARCSPTPRPRSTRSAWRRTSSRCDRMLDEGDNASRRSSPRIEAGDDRPRALRRAGRADARRPSSRIRWRDERGRGPTRRSTSSPRSRSSSCSSAPSRRS